ncbi:MAG: hypothetical protein NXH75_09785 [Halobacteriovoraceae bacterium]|nr:hypothetical protein [Halobacteriovoraceae bacterium]
MISGNKKIEYLFTFLVTATLGFIAYKQSLLVESVKTLTAETEKLKIEVPSQVDPVSLDGAVPRFADQAYCGRTPGGRVIAKLHNKNKTMDVTLGKFCNQKRDPKEVKGKYWMDSEAFYFELYDGKGWKEVNAVKNFTYDSNKVVKTFTVHGYTYTKELCFDKQFLCKK